MNNTIKLFESIQKHLNEGNMMTCEYYILNSNKEKIGSYTSEPVNIDYINDQDPDMAWPGLKDAIQKAKTMEDACYIITDNLNGETMLVWDKDFGETEEYWD